MASEVSSSEDGFPGEILPDFRFPVKGFGKILSFFSKIVPGSPPVDIRGCANGTPYFDAYTALVSSTTVPKNANAALPPSS